MQHHHLMYGANSPYHTAKGCMTRPTKSWDAINTVICKYPGPLPSSRLSTTGFRPWSSPALQLDEVFAFRVRGAHRFAFLEFVEQAGVGPPPPPRAGPAGARGPAHDALGVEAREDRGPTLGVDSADACMVLRSVDTARARNALTKSHPTNRPHPAQASYDSERPASPPRPRRALRATPQHAPCMVALARAVPRASLLPARWPRARRVPRSRSSSSSVSRRPRGHEKRRQSGMAGTARTLVRSDWWRWTWTALCSVRTAPSLTPRSPPATSPRPGATVCVAFGRPAPTIRRYASQLGLGPIPAVCFNGACAMFLDGENPAATSCGTSSICLRSSWRRFWTSPRRTCPQYCCGQVRHGARQRRPDRVDGSVRTPSWVPRDTARACARSDPPNPRTRRTNRRAVPAPAQTHHCHREPVRRGRGRRTGARDALPDLCHIIAAEQHVEFLMPGANKATGLRSACEALGVSMAETVAFGDADNDVEMLAAACRTPCHTGEKRRWPRRSEVCRFDNANDGVAVELRRCWTPTRSPRGPPAAATNRGRGRWRMGENGECRMRGDIASRGGRRACEYCHNINRC